MAFADNEQEQVEALQRWWREHGSALLIGLGIALTGVLGWQGWQGWQQQQAEQAALRYLAVEQAPLDDNTLAELAKPLRGEHPDSAYATFAAMRLAAAAVAAGDLEGAVAELQWAYDHAKPSALQPLLQLRLAQLRLAQGDLEAAGALLKADLPPPLQPLQDELRGDWHLAQGDRVAARAAYGSALVAAPSGGQRQLLQMKFDDVADGLTAAGSN